MDTPSLPRESPRIAPTKFVDLIVQICILLSDLKNNPGSQELAQDFLLSYRRYGKPSALLRWVINCLDQTNTRAGALLMCRIWVSLSFGRDFWGRERSNLRKLLRTLGKLVSGCRDDVNRVKLAMLRGKAVAQKASLTIQAISSVGVESSGRLFACHAEEIAKYMTALEFAMFSQIDLEKFADSKEPGTRIKKLTERSNTVSLWVASHILAQKDRLAQARVIQRFIMIAHYCENLGNYNSLESIIRTFAMGSIDRLRNEWKISSQHLHILARLNKIMLPVSGYAAYRTALAKRQELLKGGIPTLPYIGVLRRAATLIDEGNPDYVETGGRKRINVEKISLIGKTLREIQAFRQVPYQIKTENKALLRQLTILPHWSLERIESASESIRPRNTDGSSIEDTSSATDLTSVSRQEEVSSSDNSDLAEPLPEDCVKEEAGW